MNTQMCPVLTDHANHGLIPVLHQQTDMRPMFLSERKQIFSINELSLLLVKTNKQTKKKFQDCSTEICKPKLILTSSKCLASIFHEFSFVSGLKPNTLFKLEGGKITT